MEVERYGTTRQELPAQLTECVKAMGRSLTTTSRVNQDTQKRIGYINQIAVFDWERGIFKINFVANGESRYHRLSPERKAELQAQDSYVQDVVKRVSSEIVDGMKLFQQKVGLPDTVHEKFRQKVESKDPVLQEMLDRCGIIESYEITVENQKQTVFVMIDRDHFDLDPIFKEIMSPAEYKCHFNCKLIDQFLHACPIALSPTNPPRIIFSVTEALLPTMNSIRERYQNAETGMANDVVGYISSLIRKIGPDPKNRSQVMILKAFLALLISSTPAPAQGPN